MSTGNRPGVRSLFCTLAVCVSVLLASGATAQPLFTEVLPSNPYEVSYNIIWRGTALGDYDNDGWIDLFFSGGWRSRYLVPVHNQGNGRFADHGAAIQAQILDNGGGGLIFADYDRDGDLDLFRPAGYPFGFTQNMLLRNDRGVFVDVTEEAGLTDAMPTDNAIWLDYNQDGYPDLYIGNMICQPNEPIRDTVNLLYRNNGDGTFTDVTEEAGLAMSLGIWDDKCNHGSNGGIAAADFDNDGWPDLYVGVFGYPNRLFLNDRAGGFYDATTDPLGDPGQAFMVAVGDIDNDGDLDLFQVNQDKGHLLLENLGGGQFRDVTAAAGLPTSHSPELGAKLVDVNNDGHLDLILTYSPFRLFLNNGDGTFVEQTAEAGIPSDLEGGLLADYDGDGFVDLLETDDRGIGRFFRGIDNGNHWLQVELVGRQSEPSGIGARLTATAGELRQIREILGGTGYDQEERMAHFGLASRTRVDELEIRWPSGQLDRLTDIPANQKIRVIEGQGTYHTVRPSRWEALADSLVAGATIPFSFRVRPTLFDAQTRITRAVADLSALGGGSEVPLTDQGDGVYALAPQILSLDLANSLRRISVMIDQETSVGPRWVRMSRELVVLPAADLVVLDEGLAADWEATSMRVAQLDLAQAGMAYTGETSCAMQVTATTGWTATFRPASLLDSFGYGMLRFAFHPGTITPPASPRFQLTARPGKAIDLLGEGRIDLAEPGWQVVELPMSLFELGGQQIQAFVFAGNMTGEFYLDDVRLAALRPSAASPTAVQEERSAALPQAVSLSQNYPNPFNSETVIGFALPVAGEVELTLFNLAGQRVATLAQGHRAAGVYTLRWDGRDDSGRPLASGVYLYRLQVGEWEEARKLLLLR